jgi:hypothetical protein
MIDNITNWKKAKTIPLAYVRSIVCHIHRTEGKANNTIKIECNILKASHGARAGRGRSGSDEEVQRLPRQLRGHVATYGLGHVATLPARKWAISGAYPTKSYKYLFTNTCKYNHLYVTCTSYIFVTFINICSVVEQSF